jgi:hypothetical protein
VGQLIGDVAGNHDHRHPGLADGTLHRYPQQPRHLTGGADHLAVVTALGEQPLGVRLLEEARSDLAGGDVCGKREHRSTIAVRIV